MATPKKVEIAIDIVGNLKTQLEALGKVFTAQAAVFTKVGQGMEGVVTSAIKATTAVTNLQKELSTLKAPAIKFPEIKLPNVQEFVDGMNALKAVTPAKIAGINNLVAAVGPLNGLKISTTLVDIADGVAKLNAVKIDSTKFTAKLGDLSKAIQQFSIQPGFKFPAVNALATGVDKLNKIELNNDFATKLSTIKKALDGLTFSKDINFPNVVPLAEGVRVLNSVRLNDVTFASKLATVATSLAGMPKDIKFPNVNSLADGVKTLNSLPDVNKAAANLGVVWKALDQFKLAKDVRFPNVSSLVKGVADLNSMGLKTDFATKLQGIGAALKNLSYSKDVKFPDVTSISKGMEGIMKIDVVAFTAKVKGLGEAIKKLDASGSLQGFKGFAETLRTVEAAIGKTGASAQSAGGKVSGFTKRLLEYAQYRVVSTAIRALQDAFQGAGTAIMEYDQALKDLQAITSATNAEVSIMGDKIIEVATKTKFSASEVAKGMLVLGQAGFSAAESIDTIQAVADLATGTLSDMAATVDLMSTAMRVFDISASNSGHVADVFANAVNKSKLTIDKLTTAFNYVGPIAHDAGISFEETAATLMTLANSGMRASTIGTSLRNALSLLVDPSEKLATAADKAGVSLKDLDPQSNSLSTVIKNLGIVVGGAGDAFDIFGKRGASAILTLIDSNNGFDSMLETVHKSGAAAAMAAVQVEGLGVMYKNLKDRVEVLAISLGNAGVTDILKGMVTVLKTVVSAMDYFVNSSMGGFITKAVVYATSGATLLMVFNKLRMGVVALSQAYALNVSAAALQVAATNGMNVGTLALGTTLRSIPKYIKAISISLAAFIATPAGAVIAVIATALVSLGAAAIYAVSTLDDFSKASAEATESAINFESLESGMEAYFTKTKDLVAGSTELKEANLALRKQLKETVETNYDVASSAAAAAASIDPYTGAILDNTEAISAYNAEVSKLKVDKLMEAAEAAGKSITANTQAWATTYNASTDVVTKGLSMLVTGFLKASLAGSDFFKTMAANDAAMLRFGDELKASKEFADSWREGGKTVEDLAKHVASLEGIKFDDLSKQGKVLFTEFHALDSASNKVLAVLLETGAVNLDMPKEAVRKIAELSGNAGEGLDGIVYAFEQVAAAAAKVKPLSVGASLTEEFRDGTSAVDEYITKYKEYGGTVSAEQQKRIADTTELGISLMFESRAIEEAYKSQIASGLDREAAEAARYAAHEALSDKYRVLRKDTLDDEKSSSIMLVKRLEDDANKQLAILDQTHTDTTTLKLQQAAIDKQLEKDSLASTAKFLADKNAILAGSGTDEEKTANIVTLGQEANARIRILEDEAARQLSILDTSKTHIAGYAEAVAKIKGKLSRDIADAMVTGFDTKQLKARLDVNTKNIELAAAQQLQKVALLEADGTIIAEEASARRYAISLSEYDSKYAAALEYYTKLQSVQNPDVELVDKANKALLALAEQRTSFQNAELVKQTADKKKASDEIDKLDRDLISKQEDRNDEIKRSAEKLADDLEKERKDLSEKILAIDEKELERIKASDKAELESAKKLSADIASIRATGADKIRAIKQRGMSDVQKEADNESAANAKLREGIDLVATARENKDTAALERGRSLIGQAQDIGGGLANENKAIGMIRASVDALEDARNTEEYLNQLKKEEEAQKSLAEADKARAKARADSVSKVEDINKVYLVTEEKEGKRHAKEMGNLDKELAKWNEKLKIAERLANSIVNSTSTATVAQPADTTESKLDSTPLDNYTDSAEAATTALSGVSKANDDLVASMNSVRRAGASDIELRLKLSNTKQVDAAIAQFRAEAQQKVDKDPIQAKADIDTSDLIARVKELRTEYWDIWQKDPGGNSITLLAEDAVEASSKIAEISAQFDILGVSSGDQALQDKVNLINAMQKAGVDTSGAIRTLSTELESIEGRDLNLKLDGSSTIIDEFGVKIKGIRDDMQSNPFVIGAELGVSGTDTLKSLQTINGLVEAIKDKSKEASILAIDTKDAEDNVQGVQEAKDALTDEPVAIPVETDESSIIDSGKAIGEAILDGATNGDGTLEVPISVNSGDIAEAGRLAGEELANGLAGVEIKPEIKPGIVRSPWVPLTDGIATIKSDLEDISNVSIQIDIGVSDEKFNELLSAIENWDGNVAVVVTVTGTDDISAIKKIYDTLVDKLITLKLAVSGAVAWQSALNIYNSLRNKTVVITTIQKSVIARAAGGPVVPEAYADGGDVFRRLPSPYISSGGGTRDDVPAMLMRGEFVLKQSAVSKYGLNFLHALNQGMMGEGAIIPKLYAAGGHVQSAADGVANAGFMAVRGMQLGANPGAPLQHGGVTYHINAPSFHEHVANQANAPKSARGKSSASSLMKSFGKIVPRMSTGGSTDLLAQFLEEKNLITGIYDADIDFARENGDDQEVFLLEMEKLQLEQLALSLSATLNQIRLDYEAEMIEATTDLDDKVADFQNDKDDAAMDYADALSDLAKERADIDRDYIGEKATLDRELVKRKSILDSMLGYDSKYLTTFQKSPTTPTSVSVANANVAAIREDISTLEMAYNRDVDNTDTEQETEEFRYSRAVNRADGGITRANSKYERKAAVDESRFNTETQSAVASDDVDSRSIKAETSFEVRKNEATTDHTIRKLELDLQLELLHLRQKYEEMIAAEAGTATVQTQPAAQDLGIKYWLNSGGPVGYPAGKKRGVDDILAMLTPGEFVLNEGAVQHYGVDFIAALNNREVDPNYGDFPSFLSNPKMVQTPTTINGVTYHVNAPSFHDNLADRSFNLMSGEGQVHATNMVRTFSDAVPHLAEGGDIGDSEQQLTFELDAVNSEYAEKIQYAKDTGQSDLAYILDNERIELQMIAEELLFTLDQLRMERDFALMEAEMERESDSLDAQLDYEMSMMDLQSDRIDAKFDMEDKIADADYALAEAKAAYMGDTDKYNSDLDLYNRSRLGMDSNPYTAKVSQDVDKWADKFKYYTIANGMSSDQYRYSNPPDWLQLERMTKAGRSGTLSWGSGTTSSWLGQLADFKIKYFEALGQGGAGVLDKPMAPSKERYEAIVAMKNTMKDMAIRQYSSLMDMYAKKEVNVGTTKVGTDGLIENVFKKDNLKANRTYDHETVKSAVTARTETDKLRQDTEKEYTDRERDVIHEVRTLEMELAKALFDLKKEYGTSDTGAGVSHWLNDGGAVGYPSTAARGVDSIKAMLTPGEYVISEPAVRKFGSGFFDKLNKMKIPTVAGFNEGGVVSGAIEAAGNLMSSDTFLGTVNLGVGDKTIPVKTNLKLAQSLIKEFKKMGMTIA